VKKVHVITGELEPDEINKLLDTVSPLARDFDVEVAYSIAGEAEFILNLGERLSEAA